MELLLAARVLLLNAWMCVAASTQIHSTCRPEDKDHCYYLFKDSNKLTWYQADSKCKSLGYSLVSIPDQATQNNIEHLLASASLNYDVNSTGIWTGGTVSNDTLWRTLNLSTFQGVVNGQDTGYNNFAAIKKMQTGTKLEVVAYGYNYVKYPLCQEGKSGGCSNAFAFGDLCYKQLAATTTWYSAVKLCAQYGATLAYTDLHRQDFIDSIKGIIDVNDEFWTGIFRRPWFWNKQYDFREEWIMRYYNWAPGPVNQGRISEPYCVFIRGDQGYLWGTRICESGNTNYRYQYFICEEDPSVPGKTQTTTTTSTTTTTTSTATTSLTQAKIIIEAETTMMYESSQHYSGDETCLCCADECCTITKSMGTAGWVMLGTSIFLLIVVLVLTVIVIMLRRKLSRFEKYRSHTSLDNQQPNPQTDGLEYEQVEGTQAHSQNIRINAIPLQTPNVAMQIDKYQVPGNAKPTYENMRPATGPDYSNIDDEVAPDNLADNPYEKPAQFDRPLPSIYSQIQ